MKRLAFIVALLAAALALTTSKPINVVPEAAQRPAIPVREIPQLLCDTMLGTGIIIDQHTILTANHVITEKNQCALHKKDIRGDDDRSVTVIFRDHATDFAELTSHDPLPGPAIPISCDPMIAGETYWMIGYSLGEPVLDIHEGIALTSYYRGRGPDGYITDHLRGVLGTTYTGMSGGPVLNSAGQAVGFVSSATETQPEIALIKEFADTNVCKRSDK